MAGESSGRFDGRVRTTEATTVERGAVPTRPLIKPTTTTTTPDKELGHVPTRPKIEPGKPKPKAVRDA